jgi:hypothetical protein
MPSGDERLDPKLEAVLCRLCDRLGVLTMTNASKLPYLVDVVANHVLGRPITGVTHQTWKMGVVTADAWTYFSRGGAYNDPFIIKDSNQFYYGKKIYLDGEPDSELSPEEAVVTDFVADTWGHYAANDLGRLTKALNTQMGPEVWGDNQPATTGEDAFARLSVGWQAFHQRLQSLDFHNQSHWGEPIGDALEYLERELGA